jgi:dihydropteroate synthase
LPDGRSLAHRERTAVMGILNVTPDSFSDGGRAFDCDAAIAAVWRLIEEGADIVDIGGESTRPGAAAVDAEEEWRRVGPVIEAVAPRCPVPISIDTYKAEVARRALDLGAAIVNDVSGLTYDHALGGVVASHGAAVILMHNRGRSADMYSQAQYAEGDVVGDVVVELGARDRAAREMGIAAGRIILDPGLGFAKRAEHTFAVLAEFDRLASLGRPILSGPSRKSFLNAALGDVPAAERAWGTAAAVTASILAGAHIGRVHDVRAMVQVARVADMIRAAHA